jgi:hypothetical protein
MSRLCWQTRRSKPWWTVRTTMRTTMCCSLVTRSRSVCAGHGQLRIRQADTAADDHPADAPPPIGCARYSPASAPQEDAEIASDRTMMLMRGRVRAREASAKPAWPWFRQPRQCPPAGRGTAAPTVAFRSASSCPAGSTEPGRCRIWHQLAGRAIVLSPGIPSDPQGRAHGRCHWLVAAKGGACFDHVYMLTS